VETRPLGRTGLTVSRIGLGLAAVGRPAYITTDRDRDLGPDRSVEALRARAHELLDAAVAAGIRYVDVARSYGLAEAFLGEWLRSRTGDPAADSLIAGSKWGYAYVGEWRLDAPVHEVKDHSLAMLRRQLAESRQLLGDRLRLYQVHSATFESGILDDGAVLAELLRLADDGLAIGLTVTGPNQSDVMRRAMAVEVDGRNPFGTVQATWNLLEPSVGPALAEAHATGRGVLVKEALANGRLAAPEAVPATLAEVAARNGVGPDAIALAAVLAQPWADVVLSGAATVDQLRANVGAATVTLEPDELARLSGLSEPADRYWAERSKRAWA
jgi:aryl-alcohol dehydrogenase-like predicted oxidoreductase